MERQVFWEPGQAWTHENDLDGWTLPSVILKRAERNPDQVAFDVRDASGLRRITWAGVGREMAVLSLGLSSISVHHGSRVAIMGDTTIEWVQCDYAVLAAGGVTVGVYPTNSIAEVQYTIRHSGATVFIAQNTEHLSKALEGGDEASLQACVLMEGEPTEPPGSVPVHSLAALREYGAAALAADESACASAVAALCSNDLARIVYTSGTTGRPKGAMFTHRAWLMTGEQWVLRCPAIREREHRSIAFLSTAHVSAAVAVEVTPLVSQLVPYFDPSHTDIIEMLPDARPHVLAMTPRFFQKIAVQVAVAAETGSRLRRGIYRLAMKVGGRVIQRYWAGRRPTPWGRAGMWLARRFMFRPLLARFGLEQVSRAQTGSAVMPPEVAVLWAVWGIDIREAYGLTETAGAVSYQQSPFPRPGNIGQPMHAQPSTDLRLANDGEILFSSPMMFNGYWNDAEATARTVVDGWLHTKDLGEWTPHGNLRLLGRKNDAISTVGGKTVNPAEVERPLKLSRYISEAIIVGDGRKYLAALVELEFDTVALWACQHDLSAGSYSEIAQTPEVIELISSEIERANQQLARVEQIKKFRILPQTLDSVPGALTSTRKVKRGVVGTEFHDLIESMYDHLESGLLQDQSRRAVDWFGE